MAKRRPTFEALVVAEPRLRDLLEEAQALQAMQGEDPCFCANTVWYGRGDYRGRGLKDRTEQLVGWSRTDNPTLGNEAAYRVAYDTIYDALPDCRACGCWPGVVV